MAKPRGQCLHCGARLPLYLRFKDTEFCSAEHGRAFRREQERRALDRLADTGRRLTHALHGKPDPSSEGAGECGAATWDNGIPIPGLAGIFSRPPQGARNPDISRTCGRPFPQPPSAQPLISDRPVAHYASTFRVGSLQLSAAQPGSSGKRIQPMVCGPIISGTLRAAVVHRESGTSFLRKQLQSTPDLVPVTGRGVEWRQRVFVPSVPAGFPDLSRPQRQPLSGTRIEPPLWRSCSPLQKLRLVPLPFAEAAVSSDGMWLIRACAPSLIELKSSLAIDPLPPDAGSPPELTATFSHHLIALRQRVPVELPRYSAGQADPLPVVRTPLFDILRLSDAVLTADMQPTAVPIPRKGLNDIGHSYQFQAVPDQTISKPVAMEPPAFSRSCSPAEPGLGPLNFQSKPIFCAGDARPASSPSSLPSAPPVPQWRLLAPQMQGPAPPQPNFTELFKIGWSMDPCIPAESRTQDALPLRFEPATQTGWPGRIALPRKVANCSPEPAALRAWMRSALTGLYSSRRVLVLLVPLFLVVASITMFRTRLADKSSEPGPLTIRWAELQHGISTRAGVNLSEDFRSGLENWVGQGGASDSWTFDETGFVKPGKIAIYRPSIGLNDYTMEFLAQLDKKALSWILRARDSRNYQAVKLVVSKPGPLPTLLLRRYVVLNGREMAHKDTVLPITLRGDTMFNVMAEARGGDFSVRIQGRLVDSWTENRLPTGGIGFFTARGESSRIRWVHFQHHYDVLGRLCAILYPPSFAGSSSHTIVSWK